MKKVKITVLKTTLDEELAREYGAGGAYGMPDDEGRTEIAQTKHIGRKAASAVCRTLSVLAG